MKYNSVGNATKYTRSRALFFRGNGMSINGSHHLFYKEYAVGMEHMVGPAETRNCIGISQLPFGEIGEGVEQIPKGLPH